MVLRAGSGTNIDVNTNCGVSVPANWAASVPDGENKAVINKGVFSRTISWKINETIKRISRNTTKFSFLRRFVLRLCLNLD